jgi:hypothetical protein
MFIKGLIGGALLGVALPLFAVGVLTGAMVSRAPKRQRSCKHCCFSCNGSCQSDQAKADAAMDLGGPLSRSDFSI